MPRPQQLESSAQKALGSLSPKDAWFLLVDRAWTAEELDPKKLQQLVDEANILNQPDGPLEMHDLSDLQEVLVGMDPVRGIDLFHYMNPEFNLQAILQAEPLDVFQKLLAIFKSDRMYMTIGD